MPQDEQPLRNRRCKCIDLGQWLHSIVSSTRVTAQLAPPSIPCTPEVTQAQTRSVISLSRSAIIPKKKADETPSSRFAIKRKNLSPEQELAWTLSNSDVEAVYTALAKNPDPFSDTAFINIKLTPLIYVLNAPEDRDQYSSTKIKMLTQKVQAALLSVTPLPEQLTDIIGQYIGLLSRLKPMLNAQETYYLDQTPIQPMLSTLEAYMDQYLVKHINRLAQPAAQEALLGLIQLPEALTNIICNYIGSYQLSSNVMQYLGTKIHYDKPLQKNVSDILPYCTEEKGKSLVYYVDHNLSTMRHLISYGIDLFNIQHEEASRIFKEFSCWDVGLNAIEDHLKNLQKDPILFASPIDHDLFFHSLRRIMCCPIAPIRNFEQTCRYQDIKNYIATVPTLLTMHDAAGDSAFDHAYAVCALNVDHAVMIGTVLKLFLESKAYPNMQNNDGDTVLHRAASTAHYCGTNRNPADSPFIKLYASQLDPSIKNNRGATVIDILNTNIRKCYIKQWFKKCKYYQKFMDKLTAIQASQQVTKQPHVSKSAIAAKIVALS